MPKLRIGTYNVNNLFDRFDDPFTIEDDKYYRSQNTSPVPHRQRFYLSRVLLEAKPDILAFQEIESKRALWEFNEASLGGHFKNLSLVESEDFRGIDVAIATISRFPLGKITSHQFAAYRKKNSYSRLFSRDLLEVDILYRYGGIDRRIFTFFITHLKSQFVNPAMSDSDKDEAREYSDQKRRMQAEEIVRIIKRKFPDPTKARFIIAGDMNDTPDSNALAPLFDWGILTNPVQSLPDSVNWTFKFGRDQKQFDYLLLSPPLLDWFDNGSIAIYHPIDRDKSDDEIDIEIPGVASASDHCLLTLDLQFSSKDIGPEDTWEVPRWET